MSKIIGITVGTQLPKPNFNQTDPTKGDYIKNKPDFDGLQSTVNNISHLVGDTSVAEQIDNTVTNLGVLTIDITDADAGTANLINADSLGGIAASEYALKSEVGDALSELNQKVEALQGSGGSLSVDESGDATIHGSTFAVDENGNAVI